MCNRSLKGKFIAFYKRELLSEYILDYIICKALCGLITHDGAKLILIHDTRHGKADGLGLRTIGKRLGKTKDKRHWKIARTMQSDCITLRQLIRKNRKTKTVTDKSKNAKSTPFKNNMLEGKKGTKTPTPTPSTKTSKAANSRNVCSTCNKPFLGKRSDAKFCSAKCRQKSHRWGSA